MLRWPTGLRTLAPVAAALMLAAVASEAAQRSDSGRPDLGAGPPSGPLSPRQREALEVSAEQDPPPPPPDLDTIAAGTESPGTDDCRGMTWEPTIAVDPNNPSVVALTQFSTIQISIDGGATFPAALQKTVTVPGSIGGDPGWCAGGDPSIAFDSQGRLFHTILGRRLTTGTCASCPSGTPGCQNGRDVFLSGFQRVGNDFVLFVGPVNVTALSGHGAPHNADKEWLCADAFPGHAFSDRLYVTWSDIDQTPWEIWTTFSSDQGATWSAAQQLSIAAEGPKVWPPHNTVAPNHDVYVAYHSQTGFVDGSPDNLAPDAVSGQILAHRSNDGGVSYTKTATDPYGPSECDMTWNVQHKPGSIPNASYLLIGSVQPWVLADPHVAGRIYVVANDDPSNVFNAGGDFADVFIVRSDDFGASWTAPIRVDDGPGTTFAVMPTAAIDPISGAIGVMWYDNRALQTGASGDWLLDLRATYSADDGTTWLPSIDVNDGLFDPGLSISCRYCCNVGDCSAGSPITRRIGEYNGIAYGACMAHMVWADNQTCGTGTNPIDTFYDRDPELGGDLTPPTILCPPNVQVGCNDPTDPANTGLPVPTDNCDPNPDLSWVDEILPGNCPPSTVLFTIRRIFSATDQAGNLATCEQLITVADFQAPTIDLPPDLVINGNTTGCVDANDAQIQNWIAQVSAFDECGPAQLSFNLPDFFPADCPPGRRTNIIFSAEDPCGNSDFAVGHVTVVVAPGAGTPFCFGDGSGTACPCGNTGLGGHGCDIAQATGGVCLTAQNFMPDFGLGGTVDLLGTNFPLTGNPPVIGIRSQVQQNGGLGSVFGDGLLCVAPPVVRVGTVFAADGKVVVPVNHAAGHGTFHYQLWFRNTPASFCDAAAAFNLSNAVTLIWPAVLGGPGD